MNRILKKWVVLAALLLLSAGTVCGQPFLRLPAIVGDHMVLQADTVVTLHGWADPNARVTVSPSWGEPVTVRVGYDTKWEVKLKTPEASSKVHTIVFQSNRKASRTVKDVLIGQVWLCSGQSNMNWSAANGIVDMKQELTGKLNPQIRLFTVTKNSSPYPVEDCVGRWEVCDVESALYFSAVGYFFGKRLAEELRQPVGLVNSSWGGTPVEVWTPASAMKKNPQMADAWKKHSKYGRGWDIGSLYNAMIVPLLRTTFAGAIWYQGESNKENAALYGEEFRLMIESWRKAFHQTLPFYFVQIAPHARTEGGITGALVREQQARVAATVPETGMVVISDLVDDVTNIHPAYKKGVGDRLAGWALGEVYGKKDHKYRHATFRSAEFKRNQVIVAFDYAEGGLVCPDGAIAGLEVCDASMRFVPAQGMIDERSGALVVWSKGVSRPVAVRYCFSDGAIGNLFDAAGLPVAPFRSDADNAAAPARLPDDAVSRMEVTARGDGFEVRSFTEGAKIFLNRVYPLTMVPARFAGFEMLVHNAGSNLELPCSVTASAAGRIYLIARRNSMTAADLRGWKRERNSEVRYSTRDKNNPGILDIYYKEVKAGEKLELPTTKDFAGITLLAAKIGYTNPNPKAEVAKTASAPVSRMLVTARGEGYEVRSFGVGVKPFLNRVYPLSMVPERFVGFKMLAHEAGQKLGQRCTVTAGSDGRIYLVARRNKYTAADLKGWTREPDSEVRYTTHDKSKPGILDIYYKEVKSGDRVSLPVTDDFAGMTLIAAEIEYEK